VAAVVESVQGAVQGNPADKRVRYGNVEPAIVAVLKQLDPLIAVLTFLGCEIVFGEKLSPTTIGVALIALITSSAVFSRSSRDSDLSLPLAKVYPRILLQWSSIVAVLLLLAFAFKASALFSRAVMLTWFTTTPVALFAVHALRRRAHPMLLDFAGGARYIIVGANNVGFELFRRLPKKGFLGFFDFRSPDRVAEIIDPGQLIGHCRDLTSFARSNNVTAIYIALPLSNVPRIGEMVRELRDTTASVYFIPDVFAFDMIQGRLVDIHGLPAISVCDTPFHGIDALLKRSFDLLVAGLAVLLAAPLMLLIATLVKLTSRGPILFRQRRYGLNGEQINVYKFRTMTVCEDGADVKQATRDDMRITFIGSFLRRTSLDELPQLVNVLQGKMSLVGPRPHAVAHNEQYRKLICGYMIRHKVRPGITGWAQVNGLRGETDTIEKMRARVKYDIEYLNSWSPWLDLKILARTLMLVIRDDQAY
jgi:putative colanic acid biosysnthesis UDP-glucose lipid carrier transferase